MNINEPARRDPDGEPLVFAVKPQWDILRRLAPGETGPNADRSLDGVAHDTVWRGSLIFPRDPGDRVVSHIVRVEEAARILDHPYCMTEQLTRRDLGAVVVSSRHRADWTPWAVCGFAHRTYRFGRDDGELLASFERYVSQTERHNWNLPETHPARIELMGAEDRWRWNFCDCTECATGPMVAINH